MLKFCVFCVFSQQQIGRGHVYLEYPKSAKSSAIEYAQEVLRVKCEFITLPGIFMYNQMAIASGSDDDRVSLRHSPGHFPEGEGNLVLSRFILVFE